MGVSAERPRESPTWNSAARSSVHPPPPAAAPRGAELTPQPSILSALAIHGCLDQRVPGLSPAGGSGKCSHCAVLRCVFPWRARCPSSWVPTKQVTTNTHPHPPSSCRQCTLCFPVISRVLPPGEILKSGVAVAFRVSRLGPTIGWLFGPFPRFFLQFFRSDRSDRFAASTCLASFSGSRFAILAMHHHPPKGGSEKGGQVNVKSLHF